jgi:uncharacterized membrane protein YdbT with pleckstrin-like domain
MAQNHLDPKMKLIWIAPIFIFVAFLWAVAMCAIYSLDPDMTVFGMHVALFAIVSAIGILIFVMLPAYIYYSLEYDAFTYELAFSELVIRRGVLATNLNAIPYSHITSIDVQRSVLDRALGISSINITITGPKEEEGMYVLPGIPSGTDLVSEIKGRKAETPKAAQRQPASAQAPVRNDGELALLVRELRALNLNLASLLAALRGPPKK